MKIGIMGAIGVGKSSIAKKISERLNCAFVEEPVEKNEFLPLFYKDKETFAFLSQNSFYSQIFLSYWNVKKEKKVIYDSTLLSNLVFTELLRIEGIMNAQEVALTYSIADKHLDILGHPDLYVVLQREKKELFSNVSKRGRKIEQDQKEYLNFHYDNYETCLDQLIKAYKIPKNKILKIKLKGNYLSDKKIDELINQIKKQIKK